MPNRMVQKRLRRKEKDHAGHFIDTKVHVVSQHDFEHNITTKARVTAGVDIQLMIRETRRLETVDINLINEQGLKIAIFRCPACDVAFARRKLVERHCSTVHAGLPVAVGNNWQGHVTCATFGYGRPRANYTRRTKAEIALDRANGIDDRDARAQLPQRIPAATIAQSQSQAQARVASSVTTNSARAANNPVSGASTFSNRSTVGPIDQENSFDSDTFVGASVYQQSPPWSGSGHRQAQNSYGASWNDSGSANVFQQRPFPDHRFSEAQSSFDPADFGSNNFEVASISQQSFSSYDSSFGQALSNGTPSTYYDRPGSEGACFAYPLPTDRPMSPFSAALHGQGCGDIFGLYQYQYAWATSEPQHGYQYPQQHQDPSLFGSSPADWYPTCPAEWDLWIRQHQAAGSFAPEDWPGILAVINLPL